MSVLMPFVLLDPPGRRERTDFQMLPAPSFVRPASPCGPRACLWSRAKAPGVCEHTEEQKQKGAGF